MSDKEGTPCAGCTACGGHAWALILDQYPPRHTTITHFICVACGGAMEVYVPLDKIAPREEVDIPDDNMKH